jgi:hypothetical protein
VTRTAHVWCATKPTRSNNFVIMKQMPTNHQEGCSQVDSNEGNTQVNSTTEGCGCSHDCRYISEQPQPWFRPDPVGHHAGDDGEDTHQYERRTEVGDYGSGVLFQFMIECSRAESRHRYVFEAAGVFCYANCI